MKRMKRRKDKYYWRINVNVIPEDQVTGGYGEYPPDRWTWSVDGPICKVEVDPHLIHPELHYQLPQFHKDGKSASWKEAERSAERMCKFLAKLANEPYLGRGYTHDE